MSRAENTGRSPTVDYSPREAQIAQLIEEGLGSTAISARLGLAFYTVERIRNQLVMTDTGEAYEKHMAGASRTMREVLMGVRDAPKGLVWMYAAGSTKPDRRIPPPEPETFARVYRDTCPRCGARGDYGCGHAPVRGGRLVAL